MVGSTFTGRNNIFSDASCVISGTNNRVITDVVLGPLTYAANGVPYLPLLLGSPAIDTGTNEGCPATDQRGVARPYGTNCDVGAYEYDRATYTWHMPILRR